MLRKDELTRRRQGLSAAKQAFFEKRLGREALLDVTVTALPRRAAHWQEVAPASFAQQRLWLLHQLEPESPIYHIFYIMRLQGNLDLSALTRSLNEIVRRHEILRTTFAERNGALVQHIHPPAPLALPCTDLSAETECEQKHRVDELLARAAREPFDLQNGPLLRPQLVRLSTQEHLLVIVFHHIVSDDWSVSILNRELTLLYRAYHAGDAPPLTELPAQYADYAVWQRERLQGSLAEEQRSYWLQQLRGAPPVLELPTDHPRPALQSFSGDTLTFLLPPTVVEPLKSFCQSEGVTLFMALLAAFQILLARYTGQEDIVVGSPIANRTHAEVEGLIGFFVNTLLLRTCLTEKPSFREVIKRVRSMTLEAYDHQDIPFEQLVELLRPERKLSHNPLFQVMFALQNAPKTEVNLPELTSQLIKFTGAAAKFDLSLLLQEGAEGIQGDFEYSTDLFERKTIEQFIEHFRLLVEGMLAQPDTCIWDLPLLTEEERQQLALQPPVTRLSFPHEPDFLDLFAAQVRRTPQAVAASAGGIEASYQQLDAHANFLAHQLASLGVGPESRVAVVDQRGLPLLAALLAIFKVGAAYVPIDPAQPVLRVRQLLAISGAQVVLVGEQVQQAVEHWEAQETAFQVLVLPAWEKSGRLPAFQARAPFPHQLAYVLFTSGSTGAPKGVMIEQEGMLNHLLCKIKELKLGAQDRVGQIASQSFDVSIWQMLAILLVGGRVQVIRDEVSHDPRRLVEQIERERLSVAQMVPSLLGALLDELERLGERRPAFAHLRWLMTSGEALPPDLCRRWLRLYPHVPLVNAYGPTEAADNVTHALIAHPPSEKCIRTTIGTALENAQLYVLGQYGELLPRGAHGELYIGGKGVGRGYLGEARKTAASFLPDGWSGAVGARLYRTGDVVRFLEDGSLEFVGRRDDQVKLRGYRIELGEIEEVIRAQEGVKEAVVVLRDVEGEEKRLVAYVAGRALSEEQLREAVGRRLPEYMVPWTWVVLEEFPLMINGKVDRKHLPAPQRREQEGFREPRTDLEEVLAGIWGEMLGLERVGIDENFFALGGHSLLATRFLAHMQEFFQIEIPLLLFFKHPTIAELAAFLLQKYQLEEEKVS